MAFLLEELMKKYLFLILALILITSFAYADWDNTTPSNTETPATEAPKIRGNWTALDGTSGAPPTTLCAGTTVQFEGSSADAHETSVTVTNPTADRTITIPDETGTVLTSATTRLYVGTTTRDTDTATGTQAVTGVGFQPQAVFFIAGTQSEDEMSFGFDDGTTATSASTSDGDAGNNNWAMMATVSINDVEATSTYYRGNIDSLDSDGFTISWTKTGSPTGTIAIYFLAFK